ncbi:Lysine methyltransferase, partial [Dillenia turbinata]
KRHRIALAYHPIHEEVDDIGTSRVTDARRADMEKKKLKASSLRWEILRNKFLHQSSFSNDQSEMGIKKISRKTTAGFSLIPFRVIESNVSDCRRDACVCFTLPIESCPNLLLYQREDNDAELADFEICNRYNIDNTGRWPSEDVLAYYCLTHADTFRSKRVLELGSGYGLAGLVIAAAAEASEVTISDGNPRVVDYIQRSIDANLVAFGNTKVKSLILHWDQEEISRVCGITFFKEFHKSLVQTVKLLLKPASTSEALFFSPQRGDSLHKFLQHVKESGLNYAMTENYDAEVWKRHQELLIGNYSWTNYEKDHCYPLMVRVTLNI